MPTFATAGDALRYYSEEVADLVALAVVLSERFPEEILNEIRAAFTHLARSETCSCSTQRVRELQSTGRHLHRVSLDCLKVGIILTAKTVDGMMRALTEGARLPEPVYKKADDLRRKRQVLLRNEISHPTDTLVSTLRELFDEFDEFRVELQTQYNGYHSELVEIERSRQRKREIRAAFLVGIGSSAFVAIIWEIVKARLW